MDREYWGNRSIPLYVGTEDAKKRNKVENEFFAVLHLSMLFYTPNKLRQL